MGRYGQPVIDADGHGGEPLGWRRRIPAKFESTMRDYVASMRAQYAHLLRFPLRAVGFPPKPVAGLVGAGAG